MNNYFTQYEQEVKSNNEKIKDIYDNTQWSSNFKLRLYITIWIISSILGLIYMIWNALSDCENWILSHINSLSIWAIIAIIIISSGLCSLYQHKKTSSGSQTRSTYAFKILYWILLIVWLAASLLSAQLSYVCYKWKIELNKYLESSGHWYNSCVRDSCGNISWKPVIYLYPEKKQDIVVKLHFNGDLHSTYPLYNPVSWRKVNASPDGTIINSEDKKEYSYLFRDGIVQEPYKINTNEWFIVKSEDTILFLQNTLSQIWLTPKEYNEFIVYRYPLMKKNPYNFIHFLWVEYSKKAELEINPTPDSILRVFMYFKKATGDEKVEPQKFEHFERKWFTVVERWWTPWEWNLR